MTAKGDVTIQELTKTQQVIARRMAESKATVPEFTLTTDVDMEAAADMRRQLKAMERDGGVPSYNDMVVKACGMALREHPRANGSYRDGRFELHSRVNVGIAVAAADSLVVPTVFDADVKALETIAEETRTLAERVRQGTITPPELSGATFTVSNLGMFGVTSFTADHRPAAGRHPRGRGSGSPGRRSRWRGDRPSDHVGDPGLRSPHPLWGAGRAVPRPCWVRELLGAIVLQLTVVSQMQPTPARGARGGRVQRDRPPGRRPVPRWMWCRPPKTLTAPPSGR